MVAKKLQAFGGMVPAIDDRLLPESQAAYSENVWLYNGTLEPFKEQVHVHTLTSPAATKVFRIPLSTYDKGAIADSFWMEFENIDTDVVRSPVANDSFERYYWASSSHQPLYNTRARIINGDAPYRLGVPAPETAPVVSVNDEGTGFQAARGGYTLLGRSAGMTVTRATPSRLAAEVTTYRVTGGETGFNIVRRIPQRQYRLDANSSRGAYSITGGTTELTATWSIADPGTNAGSSGSITVVRAYVYTYVTAYGEEGPPSPATIAQGNQAGDWTVQCSAPTGDQSLERNLTAIRIYRSVTSAQGIATYFFVTELTLPVITHIDSETDAIVTANNQLTTTGYTPPPENLKGMVAMPNGMIAGFTDKEVYFCEPYRPHAWPVAYALSVDFPIVGLGVIGQSLVVCTSSNPYVMTGTRPDNVASSKLSDSEPCMSRGSIVSTKNGVYYASPNGLCLVQPGNVQIATKGIIDKTEWLQNLVVEFLRAGWIGDAYYCYGPTRTGTFDIGAFDGDSFDSPGLTENFDGALIDPTNQRIAYSVMSAPTPTSNVMQDVWSGEVLVVRGGSVYLIDVTDEATFGTFLWRSKIMQTPERKNLGVARVMFETLAGAPTLNPVPNASLVQSLAADQYGLFRVYADGVHVFTREIRTSGEIMKLPSGFKAHYWQVEIEARVRVFSVEVASSAKEMRQV